MGEETSIAGPMLTTLDPEILSLGSFLNLQQSTDRCATHKPRASPGEPRASPGEPRSSVGPGVGLRDDG